MALQRRGTMSLKRPAAGGESCKQDSFLLYKYFNLFKGMNLRRYIYLKEEMLF